MLDEQSRRKQKLQEHSHVSSQLQSQELTLEDIFPMWAMRLKSENIPVFFR